jgi:hypothetical protein
VRGLLPASLGLALTCGLAFAPAAEAATYDPELDWRTLQTPHFNITFHQGEEQLADELTVIAENAWDVLTVDMALTPRRRVEVVLVDSTDVANGFAYTLPVNTIVLYVTAPQEGSGLALYEDWLEAVFTHELAHILHLDNLSGLPGALGLVMGRIISVNRLSPLWMIEGQATFMETRHTTGGRGRNPHSDMILRMATLEGALPAARRHGRLHERAARREHPLPLRPEPARLHGAALQRRRLDPLEHDVWGLDPALYVARAAGLWAELSRGLRHLGG